MAAGEGGEIGGLEGPGVQRLSADHLRYAAQMPLPSATSAISILSNLGSGLVGALLGTAIAGFVSWRLQHQTQLWTLQAELKRHRVARVAKAVEGLRICYFRGVTDLEYHLLELQGIEAAERRPFPFVDIAELLGNERAKERAVIEVERRLARKDSEQIAYNASSSKTESEAKAHFESLLFSSIPKMLLEKAQRELRTLTEGHTSNSDSVQARISLYQARYEPVMQLLKDMDKYNEAEIARAIPLSKSSNNN